MKDILGVLLALICFKHLIAMCKDIIVSLITKERWRIRRRFDGNVGRLNYSGLQENELF